MADVPVEVEPYRAPTAQGSRAFYAATADHSRPARAGAGLGFASAALLLAGGVTIALIEDEESERVTRGLALGLVGVSVPTTAILALVTRKRALVEGFAGVRTWGWVAWTGGVFNLALQWALVFDDRSISPALTIAGGAMGALGATIHGFDALVTARRARLRFDYHIGPTALGARLRF